MLEEAYHINFQQRLKTNAELKDVFWDNLTQGLCDKAAVKRLLEATQESEGRFILKLAMDTSNISNDAAILASAHSI